MPAYEYLCDACQCHFEQRQKMSDAALSVCPDCGAQVRRLISGGAGAITRGSAQPERAPSCPSAEPCCGGTCGGAMLSQN